MLSKIKTSLAPTNRRLNVQPQKPAFSNVGCLKKQHGQAQPARLLVADRSCVLPTGFSERCVDRPANDTSITLSTLSGATTMLQCCACIRCTTCRGYYFSVSETGLTDFDGAQHCCMGALAKVMSRERINKPAPRPYYSPALISAFSAP